MIEKYLVDITDVSQIPAVVYEVRERAKEKALYVFLDHKEAPNVVRGRFQPLENSKHRLEVRRPDGGFSWYHASTYCLMYGKPIASVIDAEVAQKAWGERVKHFLASFSSQYRTNVRWKNSDLYIGPDKKHLVGMSGWNSSGDGVRLHRACWYERDPIPDISDLLRADGINPEKFANSLQVVEKGFYNYLLDFFKPLRKSAQEFISQANMDKAHDLQKKKGQASARGSCVMGQYNNI